MSRAPADVVPPGDRRARRGAGAGRAAGVALLVAAAAAAGCEADTNPIENEQLARSRETWVGLKGTPARPYRYTDSDSSFTGDSWQTTIEVRADAVVRRTYLRQNAGGATVASWTEEAAALGSHTEGAPPLTIDEVYDGCASTVLTKSPQANVITLTFHPDGLLQTCVYVPKNCDDDCATGYRLTSIELLN